MFKRLCKWLGLLRCARVRLEGAGEWTPDDAQNLKTFMGTESGKKLRGLLWEECADRAFGLRDVSRFERGYTAGMCAVGQTMDLMATVQEKPEEEI